MLNQEHDRAACGARSRVRTHLPRQLISILGHETHLVDLRHQIDSPYMLQHDRDDQGEDREVGQADEPYPPEREHVAGGGSERNVDRHIHRVGEVAPILEGEHCKEGVDLEGGS